MTHKLNQDNAHPIDMEQDKSEFVSGTSRRDFLSAAGALVVSVASGSLPTEAFAQQAAGNASAAAGGAVGTTLATISAIRNGETPAVIPAVIASGATKALAAIAPGPIIESTQASPKNSGGSSAGVPPQSRTPRRASTPSVPLIWAMPNSSVTPAKVRNSDEGKSPSTASGFHPAE